jgi:tRNA (cmo5U34)-methyltransferase
MKNIKQHFESEAKEYDNIIKKLIPYYEQMIDALIDTIPFGADSDIRIIDLGCGTGTISQKISKKFPNSTIVCLDIAANMIDIAKYKLEKHSSTDFILGDFSNIEFNNQFDVVVSSLALHHLETDSDKKKFYAKIYKILNNKGVFFNADVVLASTEYLQKQYIDRWKKYMNRSVSIDEIENKWIPTYEDEDRPAKLIDQLNWLKEIGFESTDVVWKYYNFAVYGGYKNEQKQ